ncbi:hypothetical protein [Bacillus sp. FJAT-27251]|uniref:hypothetical protein n=1 Tax=Bacillus sp. FJAT-27251 TaxID=1684142 RepID=UPI0006A797E1|nr:hypothetical protein [Bacillus sp. FJAT-27251]
MQPNSYQNSLYDARDHDHHEKCRRHLFQFVQVELKDGTVIQGILHSYDRDKMYILMPKHHGHEHHEHHHHDSMHTGDGSRQFFPFFGPFGLFGFPFFGIRSFGPFFI